MPTHVLNWYGGWILLLSAFVTGAALGLRFHDDDFLGGYTSFRRRLFRLGHIAQAALGMLNILYSLSPWPATYTPDATAASVCFFAGGIAMPTVCYITGWRAGWRRLFFVPVAALITGVLFTLRGAGL